MTSSCTMLTTIAADLGLSVRHVERINAAINRGIAAALLRGESVNLNHLGRLRLSWVKDKVGRVGFGPDKGEERLIPAHYVVKFTPRPRLAVMVRGIKP